MNNKRNKLIILLFILVVFGTMLYSYDFFTSKVNTANLMVKTGSLSITLHDDDKWTFLNKNNISEVKDENYKNNFIDAKPGDIFVKKIIIENTGTLIQKLTFVTNENLPIIIKEMFDIQIIGIENKENILEPSNTKDITIKLTIKNQLINNDWQNKTIDFCQLQVFNFLNIEASQIEI